jgi:hypothetical protein
MTDKHEEQPPLTDIGEWRDFRFYMVGKLIRQDLGGDDRGYRESLVCPCHIDSVVRVIGPGRTSPKYVAHCAESAVKLAEAETMEELWSVVEHLEEKAVTAVQETFNI